MKPGWVWYYTCMPAQHQPVFTRFIVLRNPASTHAQKAQAQIADLQALAPGKVEVAETSPTGREANKVLLRQLASKLGSQTLLCIAAGDGTVNMVIETLLTDPAIPPAARRTPVLPLWGGNANDLAHMLNGSAYRARFSKIITQGHVIAVRPLTCTLRDTRTDATQTHLATCYASFGASAFATLRLSQPKTRHHPLDNLPGGRVAKELTTVIKALVDAPQLHVQEGEQAKKIYEHVFLKGSRFAKIKGTRLRLTDPHFYHAAVGHKRARSLFFHTWELANPRAVQRVAGDHAEFIALDPMWAQFDGEVFEVAAGTQVTIGLSKQQVYLLSTLLP